MADTVKLIILYFPWQEASKAFANKIKRLVHFLKNDFYQNNMKADTFEPIWNIKI